MRYEKFRIKNFKGISDTEINLRTATKAGVFALVGLNESGKTTLLEAIHSFAPDFLSGKLKRTEQMDTQKLAEGRVPRDQLAKFTGEIVVEATIGIAQSEWSDFANYLEREYNLSIDASLLPTQFVMTKVDVFERGDFIKTDHRLSFDAHVKPKGSRKNFKLADKTESISVWNALRDTVPDIAYYDSFIFDFPERIYLNIRVGDYDPVFRSAFSDILAWEGQGYELDDIIRRIRDEKFTIPWLEFFPAWMQGDDRKKIQQVIDSASAAVTRAVFGRWNEIFGEDAGKKEVIIEWNVEKGRKYLKDEKRYVDDDKHDVYVWFEIKDGTRRYKVRDRSLGFRWFFAFLLFTQFRAGKNGRRNVLFLFDEPAANLHAAAQQKLIESFPEIAKNGNMLIYSTHSHYMIDPLWLEQTFIVTNSADSRSKSVLESAVRDDESLDIHAHLYRKFANDHPTETSYFQPIIDRLSIVPSRFDYHLPSIVTEGKSDYYVVKYASKLLGISNLRVIPSTGSGTFGALIGISAGWGTKFLFLLDSDEAGLKERERYGAEFAVRPESLACLGEFVRAEKIEEILNSDARAIISQTLAISGKLSKRDIQRFFQESLAKNQVIDLGDNFRELAKKLVTGLNDRLAKVP